MSAVELQQPAQGRAPFRVDINGLRAWAVVAVILYHFGVPGFDGGFIGVDVFFVISGFLMTGIVVRGLERGNFSLIDFYMARGRRIIPALAALCLTLVVLGWFLLLPSDYKQLSTHSGYSLTFLSNIEYFFEAGYFDSASHEKWLLHTWSLSVEWQFYMLLPIVLWVAWRIRAGRPAQTWVVAAGFVLSFAASVLVTRSNPSAAFFLLHTRAWEMFGGGLVLLAGQAYPLSAAARSMLERCGLLLIALSAVLLDRHAVWPGYLAMVPVAAAMMVVLANSASVFTSNRAAQWLGDRSYSLYLWHWPVCVALVYGEVERQPLAMAAGMVATLVLGHLSYRLIETRARLVLGTGTLRAAGLLTAGLLIALAPALYVWRSVGAPGRFPAAVELAAAAESGNRNPRREKCHTSVGTVSPACRFGVGMHGALLVGDSHASVLVSALATAGAGANGSVTLLSYSGCPYAPGMQRGADFLARLPGTYQCTAFNDWVRGQIAAAPSATPVVIVGRYAGTVMGENEYRDTAGKPTAYFSTPYARVSPALLREFSDNIVHTACDAAKGGRAVYLVRPIPEMGINVPKAASRRMALGMNGDVSISLADYQARNGWVWRAQDEAARSCGVQILDPSPYLCSDGRCHGMRAGRPMYFDDDHISEYGNAVLAPMFAPVFRAH
jgi:peptidoglycan/LPS O-acetylase OafA/YrhL